MNHNNTLKIIFGDVSSKSKTKEIIYVREEDFEIPHGEDYKIAIQELDKIQNTEFNGKPFIEHFLYNDVSLWWFIYQSLISRYKKVTNFTKKFSEFLDETNPRNIQVNNLEKLEIIKKICTQKNITCSYSKSSYLKFSFKQKSRNSTKKHRFEKITREKTKKRKNLFLQTLNNIPTIKNKLIFVIPTIYRRQILDTKIGMATEGEYIQQSIINLLNQNDVVGIDIDYTFKGDFQVLLNRLNEKISWFPAELLLNEKQKLEHKKFLGEYNRLISNSDFKKIFVFNGVSLWSEIESIFKEMEFSPHIPLYLDLIDSITDYFKKNTPKAVFLPYETGPIALAFVAACKKLGIITIGVQHGYIYEFNPMYSYGNSLESNQKLGFMLPDYLLLFGDYVKNLLIKNGYPSKKLLVFGNPAFFGLHKILKNFDKKYLTNKFRIKQNQKIILFTSGKLQNYYSSHGKYDYDERIWEYLTKNFGNNQDYFLILKPHPQEKNTKVYEEILKNHNCDNAIITHDNIYNLICLSDIVISVFSSTMIDSLCFRKPVIRVKFGDEKHQIFDNTNVIITSNLESLSTNITNLIKNQTNLNKLSNNISKFVKEHYGIPEDNPANILQKILT